MDQKLEGLVNGVDREARKFASFDDYLAAQEKPEWQKPADGAVENSAPTSSAKVDGTDASSKAPSVAPATEKPKDVRRQAMEQPNYIPNGLKSEPLAHPVAPVVTEAPGGDTWRVLEAQIVTTKYELHQVEWDKDKLTYLSSPATVQEITPDWWKDIYLGGIEYARALESPEAIVNGMNVYQERIEKLNRAIQGMRGVLEEKLHGVSSERREKLLSKNAKFKENQTTKAATKMKAERKPAEVKGVGIKLADATAGAMKSMRGDKLIKFLTENGACDEATIAYVRKVWA